MASTPGRKPHTNRDGLVDWESIRAAYEAGGATVTDIVRLFHVRPGDVQAKIDNERWIGSGLTRRVRAQTESALLRAEGETEVRPQDITNAAAFNARLIKEHRDLINRSRETVNRLMRKLEAAVAADATGLALVVKALSKVALSPAGVAYARAEEIELPSDRDVNRLLGAVSLAEHTAVSKELVGTLKVLVDMERKAHYIPEMPPAENDGGPSPEDITPENAAMTYARHMK